MKKIHKILVTIFAASLVIILAACGKNGASNKGDNKQQLDLSATAPLDTIDISKSTGYGQTGNVFESFYRLGNKGKVTSGLAKSSSVSDDGLKWTFKLRDAKWSNGDQITADDFVYSWRRTLDPKTKSPYSYLFSGIKNADKIIDGKAKSDSIGIFAPDKKTVVIELEKPMAYFKTLMAYPLFGPQNEKVVNKYGKKYGTKSEYMVYSGPFKIKDWTGTGNKWKFTKNNNYWDKKVVKLDKINFTVVSNPTTGQELYQQDKLDLTPLTSQQVKNFKKDKEFKQYPYSYVTYIKYNFNDSDETKRKAMNNKNIRMAMSLAIDRDVLTKKILGDGSETPKGFVASNLAQDPKTGQDFADQQYVKNTVDSNTKLAKQYWDKGLEEIGEKGLKLTLLANNDDANGKQISEYLQSRYHKILPGLDIEIRDIPTHSATQRAADGDFDLYLSGWGGDFSDPITFLQTATSDTSYNQGKYSNKKYDELVARAQNEDANDENKRWQDLIEATKILNSEQAMTPVYQQVTAYLQKSNVKGIIHNTAGTQWSYKYAHKD
ncbi:peptide ABC transporter substrate-binding protein [Ligilactobacillus pobuzihii]|uniref:ABC transporter periplasmic protein n=1 Tax=Ligilactobacillus pobuzihii TaxID=449659 RepID=A0A0R2L985_9LACO|nr:peptide ABC transporter substrate-binding protein [Ligilactobacillus pobuzihii]KRK10658.1 ABC transporter periplasmic protein [Ligilactobacillus pobuzihii E100301 = KCTC 13174]KRN98080.1 ABC transporter periplasmic protein [Ligilactobacillus pobuzihii]GEN47487.1 peptide ABC transporter substrate-binding protein [Ligilactobacillus pobuzihii]